MSLVKFWSTEGSGSGSGDENGENEDGSDDRKR